MTGCEAIPVENADIDAPFIFRSSQLTLIPEVNPGLLCLGLRFTAVILPVTGVTVIIHCFILSSVRAVLLVAESVIAE